MWINTTKVERGVYRLQLPSDYDPKDVVLVISQIGVVLTPDMYDAVVCGRTAVYTLKPEVVVQYLNGLLYPIWAAVPTPFVFEPVVSPAPKSAVRQQKKKQ